MSAPAKAAALEALVEAHTVELHLPTVRRRFRPLAAEATRAQQTPLAYLAALLEAEVQELGKQPGPGGNSRGSSARGVSTERRMADRVESRPMAASSGIEWTNATWNPVTGCAHCYAETFAERFRGVVNHPYEQGFDLRFWPERLELPLAWRTPR